MKILSKAFIGLLLFFTLTTTNAQVGTPYNEISQKLKDYCLGSICGGKDVLYHPRASLVKQFSFYHSVKTSGYKGTECDTSKSTFLIVDCQKYLDYYAHIMAIEHFGKTEAIKLPTNISIIKYKDVLVKLSMKAVGGSEIAVSCKVIDLFHNEKSKFKIGDNCFDKQKTKATDSLKVGFYLKDFRANRYSLHLKQKNGVFYAWVENIEKRI